MQLTFCDCCGKVTTALLDNVHGVWYHFIDGVPEQMQLCQECAEKVDDFVFSIEQDFKTYEAVPREGSEEEKED